MFSSDSGGLVLNYTYPEISAVGCYSVDQVRGFGIILFFNFCGKLMHVRSTTFRSSPATTSAPPPRTTCATYSTARTRPGIFVFLKKSNVHGFPQVILKVSEKSK